MTDQPRRQLRGKPAARPAGAPNVLSNQATPNTLSTLGKAGGAIPAATARTTTPARPVVGTAPLPRLATPKGPPAQPSATDDRFERPRRRPTLGTIITIGFIVFWALRFFNGAGIGGGTAPTPKATARPPASVAPLPTPHAAKGQIVFGEEADSENCGLEKRASRFTIAVEVFWEAEMAHIVAAEATVVIIEKRDNVEIDRQEVPPDPDVGSWARFCGGGPVAGYQPGVYRLEVWNEDHTDLLSAGTFTRYDANASPSPDPTGAAFLIGHLQFGTELGADCTLKGVGDAFSSTSTVWWRADLRQPIPAQMQLRVLTRFNGSIIDNELLPASSVTYTGTQACARNPTLGGAIGYYVIGVWNSDRSQELASGGFTRTE